MIDRLRSQAIAALLEALDVDSENFRYHLEVAIIQLLAEGQLSVTSSLINLRGVPLLRICG